MIGKFFSLLSENKQTNKLQAPFANNLEHFQSQGHQQQTLQKAIEQSGWVRAGLNQAAHLSYARSPLHDLRLNLSVLLIKWGRILTVSYLRGLSYR